MSGTEYTGRDNLDVMKAAVRYNSYLTELVIASARMNDYVIDFGAGNGTFSLPVKAAGYHVACVETDPVLSTYLAAQGMTVFNDLEQIADGSVDYIYSLNVLEHIEDDTGIVALWHRKLRPGGTLLVYVPAFMILFSGMDRKVGHIRRYTKPGLTQTLAAAGFNVDDSRYADSLGFAAALVYKLFDKEDGAVDLKMLRLYDRWIFPFSRLFDTFTHRLGGKNVYARATKPK